MHVNAGTNKSWRLAHLKERKAKEKSLDYYEAKVAEINQKRLLDKNSTTILIWWDKRFDPKTHPFMEKSVTVLVKNATYGSLTFLQTLHRTRLWKLLHHKRSVA